MKKNSILHGLLCILFIAIGCFLPTDIAKAEVEYIYEFNKKEQAYYIADARYLEKEEELELPTSYNGYPVVGIKKSAFSNSDSLKKIIIPQSYTVIEEQAFYDCDKLEEVIIYGSIKKLNQFTFRSCDKLKTVVLPDTIKTIGEWAFYDCGIKTITLPKSVKKVDDYAFRSCDNLYQFVVEGDDITFGDWVFYEVPKNQLTFVASKGSDAYSYADGNGYLRTESSKFKVQLNGKKMFVGEKKQLLTYNNPYKVTWKTSNKKVVAIDKDGTITAKKKGSATITAKINGKSYKYKITVVKRTEKNVLNIVWSNYVTKDMTDYEKIVAANKWLAQNVRYDTINYNKGTIPMISHSAEGALAKGVAVCDGYAYAYQKIIDHYGIENKVVIGSANNGSGNGFVGHAWNLVKIGTRWYHVDVTWNDPTGNLDWDNVRDDYLLISNAKMDDDHKWAKDYYPTASKKTPDKNITTVNSNGVKVNKTSATIYVGKSTTFKITGTSKKVTWSTDNKKIATVNSKGKVTGKKAGTTKIYFKVGDKKYAVKVTVVNPSLNASKLTMTKGGNKFSLKLTGATAKKYSSSKSSVVSVSKKGVLTAKKAGTAMISVKASNGKIYKCKVTVKSYALSESKKTVLLGESVSLSVKGISKGMSVVWKSSNENIATVSTKGVVTGKAVGTTTISATVDGATYKCAITVHKHDLSWQGESSANEAKAKLVCKDCQTVVAEGIQLVDEKGRKCYGSWNTKVNSDTFLNEFNTRLKTFACDAMVSDTTLKSKAVSFLCERLELECGEFERHGYATTNSYCYLFIEGDETGMDFRIDCVFDDILLSASQKQEGETQYFYMISFIVDVYGDGSLFQTIYIFVDERR